MTDTLARLAARLATVERRLAATTRTAQLAYSSIEDGAVEVYDSDGSLRAVIGQQGDGTSGVAVVNGPPPPQPTAPVVVSILGGLAVSWPGTFADGSVVPLDWTRLEVHASMVDTFEPEHATLRGTLESPQGGTLTVPTDESLYVRLLGRNTSGTASTPSDQTGPLGPAPVVAQAVLDGIITTAALADDAVTSAKVAVAAIDARALAEAAVTAEKIGQAAVTSAAIEAGAVLSEALAANAVILGKIAENAVTDLQLAEEAVTTAKIATGAVTANELTVGSTLNLIPDPGFEGTYTEERRTGGVRSVVDGGNGSPKALQITFPAGEEDFEDWLPLLVREPILGGGQLYLSVDTTAGGDFHVFFYDANGAEADFAETGTLTAIPGTSWYQLWATVEVPDVAATMTLEVNTSGNGTTNRFDNAVARQLIGPAHIAAGAVTTVKMTANSINGDRITAGTLAAAKIISKSITAAQIYGGTITAAEIAAGALTANTIAAGAITADKLTIAGGTNALSDPSFEGPYSAALVTAAGTSWSIITPGNGSAKAVRVNAVSATAVTRSLALTTIPVLAGEQLYLGVDYQASADWAGQAIKFYARWVDGGGTTLGYGVAQTTAPVLGTTWQRLAATVTAPAGTVQGVIVLESYQATTGTVAWDNAVVRPVVSGVQIADGAITAPKITAGSITATLIAANTITAGNLAAASVTAAALATGSVQTAALAADAVAAGKISAGAVTSREIAALAITADKIAANSITADKLAAGSVTATSLAADAINGKIITGVTVTGGTVTGGIVETAATGQRIKLVPVTDFDVIDLGGGTINPPGIEFYSGDTAEQNPGYLVSYSGDEFGGTVTELSTPNVGHGTANLQLVGGDAYGRVANFTGVAGGAVTWLDPTTSVARLNDGTQLAVGYQFGANADGVYASLCNIYTATTPVHFALGGAVIYAPGGTIAKWQTVTSFGTSWATGATSGTYQGIRYRRDAQDNVHIQGTMHTTAASAAATAWTLATGYRPVTAQRIPVAIYTSTTVSAGMATIATTGAVTITPTPAASAEVYFNASLPLGNIS